MDTLFALPEVAAPRASFSPRKPATRKQEQPDFFAAVASEGCKFLNCDGDLLPDWRALLSRASLSTDFRSARSCYLRKVSDAKLTECPAFDLAVAAIVLDECTDGFPTRGVTGKDAADLAAMLRAVAAYSDPSGFKAAAESAEAWFSATWANGGTEPETNEDGAEEDEEEDYADAA